MKTTEEVFKTHFEFDEGENFVTYHQDKENLKVAIIDAMEENRLQFDEQARANYYEEKIQALMRQLRSCEVGYAERLKTNNELFDALEKMRSKADSYDQLADKICKFYEDENSEGDLCDIGEVAASHFGFL